jgi:hypothetical protein
MPSALDDLTAHQTAAPLPEPGTSDTHFDLGDGAPRALTRVEHVRYDRV